MRTPRFSYHRVRDWPPLTWTACLDLDTGLVEVLHGSKVETRDRWCGELVWNLPFEDADFDRTDVVMGTGIRLRDDEVVFVPPTDTNNRLHYFCTDAEIFVSNSLTALMVVADLEFLDGVDYCHALYSIILGFAEAVDQFPTSRGTVHLLYFRNLHVAGDGIEVRPKPDTAPDFPDYGTYRRFLSTRAREVGENANVSARRHAVTSLSTCSKGYDSPVMSLLAHEAGTRRAAVIAEARREKGVLLDTDDSGESIARAIGLECDIYDRHRSEYPHEDAVWAALGNVGDINLTIFDYPEPPCLLWTGFMGDVIWDPIEFREGLMNRQGGAAGLRFCEARLELGVIQCSPAFWAPYKEKQIQRLASVDEMKPYSVGGGYDRPVPRRILEEAGIERGMFGTHKMASTFSRKHGAPLSVSLRPDFFAFMRRRGRRAVSKPLEHVSLGLRAVDTLLLARLPRSLRFSCRDWIKLPEPNDFFLWAQERRFHRYATALEDSRTKN